jgi:hypothetical protein
MAKVKAPSGPSQATVELREKWDGTISMMKLLDYDSRETHINWMAGDKAYTLATDDYQVLWRLVKRGYEPDSIRSGTAYFNFKAGDGPLPKWPMGA